MSVKENLEIVLKEINNEKSKDQDVLLVAVSKTHPADMIKEAYDFGIRDFGENKVQELLEKIEVLPDDIRWHFIGHLQTNKVKQLIGKTFLIHSVDSLHLAEKISSEAKKKGITVDILVEINISEEVSKFGASSEEAIKLVKDMSLLENIRIMGLMTVAPYTLNPEDNSEIFKKLLNLSIDIKALNLDNVNMNYISMGMSNDFKVAIHEGSNLVRIGTNIFGVRDYSKAK